MSAFEFVTVLISIILGLGITQLLSGIADLIQQWEKVKLYWPHVLWMLMIFVLHVQEWWLTFPLQTSRTIWHLPLFLFQMLYPISLFIAARILFPAANDESCNNLKDFYFRNYRKFFLIVMTLSLLSGIDNVFYYDLGVEGWLLNLIMFMVLLVVAVRKINTEWLHQLIAVGLLVTFIVGIILNIDEWVIVA